MTTKQLIQIAVGILLAHSARADLLNLDFGADLRFPNLNKTGFAATGITAGDYWNFYSADNPDGSYKVNGSLLNLKNAGGVTTGAGLQVYNGDGAWYDSYTTDPMLYNYIYSLGPGSVQTIFQVNGLAPGKYNFYLYGPDASFDLRVGGNDYGTKVVFEDPNSAPPPWVAGKEYVLFSNVTIGASDSAMIYLGAGQNYYQGLVSGMQIELVPEPSASVLLCLGGLFLAGRAKIKLRTPRV